MGSELCCEFKSCVKKEEIREMLLKGLNLTIISLSIGFQQQS